MKPVVAGLNRKAWGVFLLAAIGAAGWFGLNLSAPALAVGPIPVRLLFILVWNVVILYGLWKALARSDFSPSKRGAAWLAVTLILTIWIAVVWTLAVNGIFAQPIFGNVPTLPIAIILPPCSRRSCVDAFTGRGVPARHDAAALAGRASGLPHPRGDLYRLLDSRRHARRLRTARRNWRRRHGPARTAGGGLGCHRFPGRKEDRHPLEPSSGLIDFAVAVTLGMLTSPGPAHLLARDHPNTLIATFPAAITPAFVVPFSTLLHLLSLRQLKRMETTAATARVEPVLANR